MNKTIKTTLKLRQKEDKELKRYLLKYSTKNWAEAKELFKL
jgi:hypothetical protein